MVSQSWFRNLWTTYKKHEFRYEKAQIAVLAFESASLMTKLLHLWQPLNDKQVARLRDEIANSVGIKKLISENDDYVGKLICAEMTENLSHVARAVARLSKKCNDPLLKSFEQAFTDLIKIGADPYNWQFSWKKMDRKIKKMERFIVTNTNLYQEMETLADLEQTLKRMKANDSADSITLVEYEKKVAWKKHEVKHLKENSLWSRTYDYTILLLARSVFTIYGKIGYVFGINHFANAGVKDSKVTDIFNSQLSHSTVFMQSSVYPSENYVPRFATGPLSRASKSAFRLWQFRVKSPNAREEKVPQRKPNSITMSGPFTGCVTGGNSPPISNSYSNSSNNHPGVLNGTKDASVRNLHVSGDTSHENPLAVVASKSKLLNPSPETLGAAALALHYANVIIFIEKLAATPHLIGNDAREDLYDMLPAGIRAALRAKLKPYAKSLSSLVYDTALAVEWNEAITKILEWLAPMAHNMIRWQSERSFEHQNLVSRMNVLLVQTLYFANQAKTEAAILELLVGLNYIMRFGREIASGRTFDEYSE